MKITFITTLLLASFFLAKAQHGGKEPFSRTTLNSGYRFAHPFDIFMDPIGDSLWVNERVGRIYKVHKTNGNRRLVLDIRGEVTLTFGATRNDVKQDGMFGMAMHPDATKGLGKDSFFVAFCYNGAANRKVKIRKYYYNPVTKQLSNPTDIVTGLWGSNDHNGGRLVFGPDKKLYYSNGDLGAGAWGDACDTIQSQRNITATELANGYFKRYAGHLLRINTDGSIPTDNPTFGGVRSLVYSKGHRNPQGLTFQKNNDGSLTTNGKFYESEQGPVTDDEINIVESGKNYGWPYIAGFNDNLAYRYRAYYKSNSVCTSFGSECKNGDANTGDTTETLASSTYGAATFTDAIVSTTASSNPTDCTTSNNGDVFDRPTVAWSSIEYYQSNIGIPQWSNSLLVTSLKFGSVLRLKLNTTNDGIVNTNASGLDTIRYFENVGTTDIRRPRDLAIDFTNGTNIYVINDSAGTSSGPSGGLSVTDATRGSLLRFAYTGATLSLPQSSIRDVVRNDLVETYPNPVINSLVVNTRNLSYRPFTLKLINASGVVVATRTITQPTEYIDVQNLRNGNYLLQLINRNGFTIANKKIVIAR